jgi:hypothetical protein
LLEKAEKGINVIAAAELPQLSTSDKNLKHFTHGPENPVIHKDGSHGWVITEAELMCVPTPISCCNNSKDYDIATYPLLSPISEFISILTHIKDVDLVIINHIVTIADDPKLIPDDYNSQESLSRMTATRIIWKLMLIIFKKKVIKKKK